MTPEDARRDLVGFVRWAFDDGPVPLSPWQWAMLEKLARVPRGRVVSMGGPMRSDGWLRRATENLRNLEAQAEIDLARTLEDAGLVSHGVDWASGPDRTVWGCSCGEWFDSLDDLATHAVRGHRWPPEALWDR